MRGNQRGFTLVEVIITVFILSLCVIPVYTGLIAGSKNVDSAQRRMIALGLAQGKLEEILSLDYRSISSRETKENFPDPYSRYSYTVFVTEETIPAQWKKISLTVYYLETGTGTEKSVVITGARGRE